MRKSFAAMGLWALATFAAPPVATAEGRFLYEFDFLLGRFRDDDNIVRQAAAGYALSQYVYFTSDTAIDEPSRRAIAYAQARSADLGQGKVVSEDGTTPTGSAGATGLAISAITYHLLRADNPKLRAAAEAWVRGLAAMQTPAGGFPSRPGDAEENSYASGEAWLALARWAEVAPGDAEAGAMLARADAYLMDKYRAHPDRQFFHWGVMAASQRFKTTGKSEFLKFIEDQSRAYLSTLVPAPSPNSNSCAGVEGLASAVATLAAAGGDSKLVDDLRTRVVTDLNNDLTMQLQPGETRVTLGQDRFYEDPKLANFAGGFRNAASSLAMRIDATQHCLSALLAYARFPAP